jgi:hypothetical protein
MSNELEINETISQLSQIVNQKTQSINQIGNPQEPLFDYKLIEKKIKQVITKKRLDSDQLAHVINLYGLFGISQFQLRFITRLIPRSLDRHHHDKLVMRIDKAVKKHFESQMVTEKVTRSTHFLKPSTKGTGRLRGIRQATYFQIPRY